MPATLAVALAALVVAIIVWAMSRSPRAPDPGDPEREERWLVSWLVRHRRLGSAAQAIDRQAFGGLLLVSALGILFATALAVGVVFDMVDSETGLARWDRAVADWGSRHATSWSTDLLDTLTNLGGTRWLIGVLAVVAVYDFIRHRNPDVPLFLFVVLAGVATVNNGLKHLIERERPDVIHLVGTSGSSFPSGHSAAAAAAWFAVALVIARHWPARRRALATAFAAVITAAVCASRALLGVHWLTDVVAGAMVGWGWFMVCALMFGGRLQRLGEPVERAEIVEQMAEPATSGRTGGDHSPQP